MMIGASPIILAIFTIFATAAWSQQAGIAEDLQRGHRWAKPSVRALVSRRLIKGLRPFCGRPGRRLNPLRSEMASMLTQFKHFLQRRIGISKAGPGCPALNYSTFK